MKVNNSLLSSIALGIALSAILSCQKNDVNSNTTKQEKVKKKDPGYCPACGMG